MPEPPKDPRTLVADEARMLLAIAKSGLIHPTDAGEIAVLESLQGSGFVAKDPGGPTYGLTVRGWVFVHNNAKKND
jgi:hypothetical protein